MAKAETRFTAALEWAKRNRDNILWGVVAVVVGVAALVYWQNKKAKEPKGQWEYLQAVYTLAQGDTVRARDLLERLSQLYPNTRWGKTALYYMGYMAYSNGNLEEAKELWERFLASRPRDPFTEAGAKAGLASVALDQGDPDRAVELLDEAAKLTPYETYKAFYLFRKAKILAINGRTEEAVELLKRIQRDYPGTASARSAKIELDRLRGYTKGAG